MIGLIIKRKRKELGLTQQEVADKGELGVSTLRKVEQLIHCPSVDTLISIGRGLGIPASELLKAIGC